MRLPLELLFIARAVYAIRVPFEVRTVPGPSSRALQPRSAVPIKNQQNAVYISNVTLGGRDIPVMLDTGR